MIHVSSRKTFLESLFNSAWVFAQRVKADFEIFIGMSEVHRPDFDALREQRSLGTREEQIRHGYKYRDAYLFPRVNLDDLSNNKYLLLFIESRVRNDPEAFAWSDSQHLQMAASASAIKLIRGDGYTMMVRINPIRNRLKASSLLLMRQC